MENNNIFLPRVLVIAHNPFSDTQSNGKTLTAFFKLWDKDNLAQIFLTTDVPDYTKCNKYYKLNDFDVFKRVFNKRIQGCEIYDSNLNEMRIIKNNVINNPILKVIRWNVTPFIRLLRDIMWKVAGYKTERMIKFIDDFKPSVVFFVSSSGVFAFEIAKWICEQRKLPLIMQTTDDYVTGKFSINPFFWIHLARLKKYYKWACAYSKCIIAIGDKMAREYRTRFGGKYFVAMNSSWNIDLPIYTSSNKTIKFLFAGNLGLNRWKVLLLIAECISEICQENEIKGELSIYSLIDPGESIKKLLNNPPFSFYKGSLNTNELLVVKEQSDVLVHVEAFDKKNKHITRLSVSTKIPEYLASGRCIFAVGPKDVASMEYLAENDLGILVTTHNKKDIKSKLYEIMNNTKSRIHYAQKGLRTAKERHNADDVASTIYKIISDLIV
jgi:glycosyltransferase involved in cell wall biosynthesis